MKKPFGYSLLVDCWGCGIGTCDDLELHYRFLEGLVKELGMTPMSAPVVMHTPTDEDGYELFPEKAGVSGWQPLIESGIQIHSLEPTHFMTLDVYSCNNFTEDQVLPMVRSYFRTMEIKKHFIVRG